MEVKRMNNPWFVKKTEYELVDKTRQIVMSICANHQSGRVSNGKYGYVPIPILEMIHAANGANQYLKRNRTDWSRFSFIDAGCGIGMTLLAANLCGFAKADGIELNKESIKVSNVLLGPGINDFVYGLEKSHVYNQDITRFKKYEKYDCIYYYCPFCDCAREEKFEEYVENQMKVGSILIPFNKMSGKIHDDDRFENKGDFYVKVKA
jgi:hypothetical protein